MKRGRVVAFLLAGTTALTGQTIHFADGTKVPVERLVVRGTTLIERTRASDDGGVVERSYRLADAVRIDWPEPSALGEAGAALAAGEAARAAGLLEPLKREHAPFSRIPGGWWTPITRLYLRALLGSGREGTPDALRTARELAAVSTQTDAIHEAHLALAELEVRSGRPDLAEAMLTGVDGKATSARLQATIHLVRADLLLARQQAEAAAESYLRVWVFYATEADLLPRALQGAINAFSLAGNETQASRLTAELAQRRPDAGAAETAPTEDSPNPSTLDSQP